MSENQQIFCCVYVCGFLATLTLSLVESCEWTEYDWTEKLAIAVLWPFVLFWWFMSMFR